MSKYELERDKIERKSTKENYNSPYSGKIKKRRSTVPNLLRAHRTSRYTTRVRKSPVVEVLAQDIDLITNRRLLDEVEFVYFKCICLGSVLTMYNSILFFSYEYAIGGLQTVHLVDL